MTKNPFDQFSKQLFAEFLSSLGEVRINYEIPGEPRFVDIWFTPSTQQHQSENLGILNKIAVTSCLLEPFRKQPTEREIRSYSQSRKRRNFVHSYHGKFVQCVSPLFLGFRERCGERFSRGVSYLVKHKIKKEIGDIIS